MEFESTEDLPELTPAHDQGEKHSSMALAPEPQVLPMGAKEAYPAENTRAADGDPQAELDSNPEEDSCHEIDSEAEGSDFLMQIEARHNRVLEDLNHLNSKIETVLEDFLKQHRSEETIGVGDRRTA
jgi:hypothetical protein